MGRAIPFCQQTYTPVATLLRKDKSQHHEDGGNFHTCCTHVLRSLPTSLLTLVLFWQQQIQAIESLDKQNHKRLPIIPAYLKCSGIKIKEGPREKSAEPSVSLQSGDDCHTSTIDRSNLYHDSQLLHHKKEAIQSMSLVRQSDRDPAFKPRGFLNGLTAATLPRRVDSMNMPDEIENANREYDKGILSRSTDQEPDEGAVMESVESDVLGAGPAANDGLYKRPVGNDNKLSAQYTSEEAKLQESTRAIRESSFSHSNLSAPNSVDKIGLDENGAIGVSAKPKKTPAMETYVVAHRRLDTKLRTL